MQAPPFPPNEAERLQALHALQLLDTPPEERFDRITRVAQHLFEVPVAVITLVDASRNWFKSCQGLEQKESPRETSFCGHAILGDDTFIIPDATRDERFADNPAVAGPPHIRFYAGHPLAAFDGSKIGTLCIVDFKPRDFSTEDADVLRDLAATAEFEANLMMTMRRPVTEERVRFFAVSIDMLCTARFDGYLQDLNPSWTKTLGWSVEELLAEPYLHFVHPDDREVTRGATRQLAEGAETMDFQTRYLCKDGTYKWLHWKASSFPGDKLIYATARDITEYRQTREALEMAVAERTRELALAKRAAEDASRAKSQLLTNLTHELKTPLNHIIGYSELLTEEAEEDGLKSFVDDLGKINLSAKSLLSLINDLLDISQLEVGKVEVEPETFEVARLVQEVADIKMALQKQGNRLELQVPQQVGTMRSDRQKIKQSLSNLLSNACKFTKEGTITVSVDRHAEGDRDWLVFEVADTGIGIKPEYRDRLFKPFSQGDGSTTRRFGGTGLGLALTKRYCTMLGGDVYVRSEEGKGATFTLHLPAEIA